jgi:beta-ribofuranosylaminobenzene 5'-phosphate synthase
MQEVQVRTGARLHLGLLDLSAATRRVDGGIGISIEEPSTVVNVRPSQYLQVNAPDEFLPLCHNIIKTISTLGGPTNIQFTLETTVTTHCGFGSGTQIALAAATALLHSVNILDVSLSQLVIAVRRGGTSGIGVHAFDKGGFIMDGGRAWPRQKSVLGPSSIFAFSDIPPCISHLPFPDWGICVALPKGVERVHGEEELQTFLKLMPIPIEEVEFASRVILTGILPAVADSDFEEFCTSVEELRQVGMKRRQWDLLSGIAKSWEHTFKTCGFRGISTSSWGPAILGFAPSVEEAIDMAKPLRTDASLRFLFITRANNKGHTVEVK